jgi:hypothetical protein
VGHDLGFNGSIHAAASMALGNRPTAATVCMVLLILWTVLVTFFETDLWRAVFCVLGGLILLSPIVHYWYVSWALAFVPVFPSLAWLTLSGTIALYFLAGLTPDWSMPPWAQIGIWTPFGILLAREALLGLRPLLTRKTPAEPATRLLSWTPVQSTTPATLQCDCKRTAERTWPRSADCRRRG